MPCEIDALYIGKDFRHYEVSKNVVNLETHSPDEHSEEAIKYAPFPDEYESKPLQRVKLSPSIKNRRNPYFTCVRPPEDLSHLPMHAYWHFSIQPADVAINAHSYLRVKSCVQTPRLCPRSAVA